MKTVLLTLVALTIAHLSYSQINKGALLLEGGLSFNHSAYDREFSNSYVNQLNNDKRTTFSLSPRIGYFKNESLMVGLGLGYTFLGTNFQSNDSNRVTSKKNEHIFSVSPYVRKYIELKDKIYFNITGRVSAGLGWSNTDTPKRPDDQKENIFELGVDIIPGFTYFVNQKWAIMANFGHLYYKYDQRETDRSSSDGISTFESNSKNTDNTIGASFALNTFGLGVQYYLRNE